MLFLKVLPPPTLQGLDAAVLTQLLLCNQMDARRQQEESLERKYWADNQQVSSTENYEKQPVRYKKTLKDEGQSSLAYISLSFYTHSFTLDNRLKWSIFCCESFNRFRRIPIVLKHWSYMRTFPVESEI